MDELKIQKNEFGGVVFSIDVEHVSIDIHTIVNSFLYWTSRGEFQPYLPWTEWDRDWAIKALKYWLMEQGSRADKDDSYPEHRRLYGGMALRFAEELFPELVYDYQEYERQIDDFRQKLSSSVLELDEDEDIAF